MTWLKTLLHLHPKALGHPLKQPPPVDDGGVDKKNLLRLVTYAFGSEAACLIGKIPFQHIQTWLLTHTLQNKEYMLFP